MFFVLLLACREREFPVCEEDPTLPELDEVPTWHGEVRSLVEQNCVGCHVEGGVAPVSFETWEVASSWAPAMANAVAFGEMPPWPPVDCCRPLQHSAALEPEEVATFLAWAENGALEGDPADYVAPVVPETGLPRIDLSLSMPEAYTPSPRDGTIDDTRCFLLDWPEDETRYVTGLGVEPGTPSQVHHALLLVAGPISIPSFQILDAADSGPGWSCPGGVVIGNAGWIGGWSPGWAAREMPPGTGQKVAKGSKLILTVHYSITESPADPDLSTVDLMLEDEVDSQLSSIPVFDPLWLGGTLRIPADEADVMVSHRTFPLRSKTLLGVNLHMHERGSSGSVGIIHPDGTEECLLQIDDWKHHWQGDYLFTTPVTLQADDALWVECHFDNTAANQRVVDGVREEPQTLTWAEDEEMCVAFLTARGLNAWRPAPRRGTLLDPGGTPCHCAS